MNSEFHTKPPRSDPDKWKPLIQVIAALAVIVPLVSVEYMIVSEMIRSESLRGLFQAILYGLLLAVLIPALCYGIWRQFNQPPVEERLRQASVLLEQQPAEQVFTGRPAPAIPQNIVIYASLPVILLLGAIAGVWANRLDLFFILLVAATLIGGVILFVYGRGKNVSPNRQVLTIDKRRQILRFEYFQFVSTFLPEKPRVLEEVAFDQVLGVDFHANSGSATLLVRTVKGSVTISESVERFDRLHAMLKSLVEINKSDAVSYQGNLNAEPQIQTPWYGWLILLGTFLAVGLLCWKFMYSD